MGINLSKLAQRKRIDENGTNKNDENSNGMPVAGPSNQNQHLLSSPIFKLDVHCFDEIFEYLSLRDLHSLGQTCKSIQEMTGEFFTRNYSAVKFNCLSDGVYMFDSDKHTIDIDECVAIPGFIRLITWIAIENNVKKAEVINYRKSTLKTIHHCDVGKQGKFKYIKLYADELKSVKKLTLTNVRLNKQTVGCILKILPNIEVLELKASTITQDLYDILLKYCKHIRRIQLTRVTFKNNNYKWLLRQYEKLEHLGLGVDTSNRIDKLCTFFECNPNISIT